MARPKIKINSEQVETLAAINCTVEEIAAVIGCSKDTLERRFAAVIKRGRENGKSSLKRMMWQKAKDGNVTMMIWLSKQLLGYTDKVEQQTQITEFQERIIEIHWADEDHPQTQTQNSASTPH